MSISSIRPSTPVVRPAAAARAQATAAPEPAKPVQVAPAVQAPAQPWTLGRIAKAGASGVGGFVAGGVGTMVADLFFHFGNNGGTAWPGGVYLMAAGAVAVAAMAIYAKVSAK